MPQSKVITTDQENREQLKSRLNEKLRGALTPLAYAPAEPEILLLPHGYSEMSETVLHFTLQHNPELKHSAESAALTMNILKGAVLQANVKFQEVELSNPVPVPEMVQEAPLKRKPSTVAPGFSRTKDSSPERADKEALKKTQFKQALADKLQRSLDEPVTGKQAVTRTLLLPSNFDTLSEADLHFALVTQRELKHSSDSALLAIDILNNRKSPKGVRLQVTETPFEVTIEAPKARPSGTKPAARARDAAVFGTQVPKLPANYQSLSEGELQFALLHTADFRYTPEAVADILDVLFSRRETLPQPKNKPEPSNPPGPLGPQHEFGTVLKLPENYQELSGPELHVALEFLPELGHTPETAALTMQILNGADLPRNTALQTVAVLAPKQDSTPAPHKRNVKPSADQARARDASIFGADPPKLPENYQSLSETELGFVLTRTTEFGYTRDAALNILDVLFGRREALPQPKATEPAETAPAPVQSFNIMLKLPSNYKDLSDPELHTALAAIPELEHTEETALLTMQILRGWERPANTTLQTIDVIAERFLRAAAPKRNIKPALQALDVTSQPGDGDFVLLLPEGYQALSESGIHSILASDAQYKQTPETIALTLDVVFGRVIHPPNIKFEVAAKKVELAPVPESKQSNEPTTLLVPSNYRDFNANDLHAILTSIPEFGHTDTSAALTLSLLSGASVPHGVEVKATDFKVEAVRVVPEPVKVEKPTTSWVRK